MDRRCFMNTKSLAGLAILCTLYLLYNYSNYSPPNTQHEEYLTSPQHSHILIVSGYRSGSTTFAAILNSDEEVFLLSEPLNRRDEIMSHLDGLHLREYVTYVTESVLRCEFENLETEHFARLVDPYLQYIGNKNEEATACGDNISCLVKLCEKYSIHLTKFVRISLDQVAHFIDKYKNIKIIWLHRDPRAIWNQKLKKDWCTPIICRNIDLMCQQFTENLEISRKLLIENPNQFTIVKFEDLLQNPVEEITRIAEFTGLNKDQLLNNGNIGQFTGERHSWQSELSAVELHRVEEKCRVGISQLGY